MKVWLENKLRSPLKWLIQWGPGDVGKLLKWAPWGVLLWSQWILIRDNIPSGSSGTSSHMKLASCMWARWQFLGSAVTVMAAMLVALSLGLVRHCPCLCAHPPQEAIYSILCLSVSVCPLSLALSLHQDNTFPLLSYLFCFFSSWRGDGSYPRWMGEVSMDILLGFSSWQTEGVQIWCLFAKTSTVESPVGTREGQTWLGILWE